MSDKNSDIEAAATYAVFIAAARDSLQNFESAFDEFMSSGPALKDSEDGRVFAFACVAARRHLRIPLGVKIPESLHEFFSMFTSLFAMLALELLDRRAAEKREASNG